MHITSILLGLVIVLNIIFSLFIVFQERRDAGTTWAWLLVLSFIPVLGFVLYLLFAQNLTRRHLFQWADLNKLGTDKVLHRQLDSLSSDDFHFRNPATLEYKELIHMHLVNNRAVYTEDNSVLLFTDGRDKFGQLFEDIENAQDFIHIQYYIIRRDTLGKRLLKALTEKARQGVKVRVLYDELGSRSLTKGFFRSFREAGGEVEVFFPSKLHLINLRLNYRNHRKIVIIDGKIGYIGGFNVGDEYLGMNPKFGYWRDTHLRIQGQAVYALQTRFILDWNQASRNHDISYELDLFPEVVSDGCVGMQIVTSGPDSESEQIKYGLIKMISSAKKSILIQTPYFIPDASLQDALRIAILSGVEVSIMIPDKPDHMFVYWATLSHIGEMLKVGARVYIYNNGFIHAKTIVVDEEIASVGTANIDVRSFRLNFEVNAFLYDEGIAEHMARIFDKDIAVSHQLTYDEYLKRPNWIKIKESISRLLSPIL
ncbi:cardiolipin synthase [Paenibacillus terreus]|uniref:Cardiolipin synthase n=1 Tax=Paenibacillus terreus TaxID=1387834 RepID=A0ABV5B5B6_9BACL